MEYIREHKNHPLALSALVLLTTGMRSNEFFALKFKDVQANGVLEIARSVDLVDNIPTEKEGTKAGTRVTRKVGLVRDVLQGIRALKDARNATDDDYIFINPEGTAWNRYRFTWQWRCLLKEIGVPYRSPHTTRHQVARNLVGAKDVHPNDAASSLGWKSTKLLLDTYSSENEDAAQNVAASIERRYQSSNVTKSVTSKNADV